MLLLIAPSLETAKELLNRLRQHVLFLLRLRPWAQMSPAVVA